MLVCPTVSDLRFYGSCHPSLNINIYPNLSEVDENTEQHEEDDAEDDGECQPSVPQAQQIIQVVRGQVYLDYIIIKDLKR